MNDKVRDYLQDKDYNLFFERLIWLLSENEDFPIVDIQDREDETSIYGNTATARVYNFSNEYLDSTFAPLNLQGKRAFVVGSSGDQALQCILNGASEVTIVDGNMWTEPYVELKLAAIKNLSYEEFSYYMTYNGIFDPKYYAKVSHDLSPRSQAFWDSIMLEFGGSSLEDLKLTMQAKDQFFQLTSSSIDPNMGRNQSSFYVDKDSFAKLKKNLDNCDVKIVTADFDEFPQVAEGEYDLIMLSNIFDYSKGMVFFSVLEELNNNHLTEGGVIQAHYTFHRIDSGRDEFMRSLETFVGAEKAKKFRVEVQEVSSSMSQKSKAANILLRKSDLNSAMTIPNPEEDGMTMC